MQNSSSELHHPILDRIEETEPLLLNLADQLMASDSEWNVVIGDDMGGRLPAHFAHRVLKEADINIPTYFVAGSQLYRDENGIQPYYDYFERIKILTGQPLRPLIVTESIGTGATVEFLKTALEPFCDADVEVAAVAAANESAAEHAIYLGGIGKEDAEVIQQAYEHLDPKSFKRKSISWIMKHSPIDLKHSSLIPQAARQKWQSSANTTVGIEASMESEIPVAVRSNERSGQLAAQAFRAMDRMAVKAVARNTVKNSYRQKVN